MIVGRTMLIRFLLTAALMGFTFGLGLALGMLEQPGEEKHECDSVSEQQ